MKSLNYLLLLISILILISCQNNPKTTNTNEDVITEEPQMENTNFVEDKGDREPTDEELNEFGLVSLVEDSGYPIFYLLIEFPERQMEEYFNVNLEKLNFPGTSLYDLKGQYISFYYLSDFENNLSDMLFQGTSVLGEYGYHDDEMSQITGILSGAEEETLGDLPGTITITSKEDNVLSFEYYVTEEMVTVNDKQVTVYYSEKVLNKITYIRMSESISD